MNQIIIFPQELTLDGKICLPAGERIQHLFHHLKLKKNDLVQVAQLNGKRGVAIVDHLDEYRCSLLWKQDQPTALPWCDLLVGLCRPLTVKKILEHGTTAGVGQFHFMNTTLSESSYAKSKILQPEHYKKYFYLGLAQSRFYTH